MSRRRLRRALRGLLPHLLLWLIAFVVAISHGAAFLSVVGQRAELRQTDLWFRLRGAVTAPQELLIVSIDERTYRELSLSTLAPLPRAIIAQLMEAIAKSGAALVVLDLFFRDPGTNPAENERLARAISAVPTYLGSFQYQESNPEYATEQIIEVAPISQLASSAEKVVLMNIQGIDTIRFFRLPKTWLDKHDSLVTAYAGRISNAPTPRPLDMIRYYGPPGTIRRVSAYDLLRSESPSIELQGKTVLIGNALEVKTGFAVKDSFMTPAGSALMSGVEIHATCIGNILHGDWIHRGDLGVELLVVSVTLFTAIIAIGSVPALAGVLTTFGIMLSWAALSYLSFLRGVFIPGHLASVIFMPIALLIVTLLKHRALRKGFAQIKDLLGLHD